MQLVLLQLKLPKQADIPERPFSSLRRTGKGEGGREEGRTGRRGRVGNFDQAVK